jgi:hypothetical protein
VKKILFGLFVLTGIGLVQAQNSVLLMHGAGKGSVQERELQTFGKNLTAAGLQIEYFAPGQCADPVKAWNNAGARPVIMHYSSSFARVEKITGQPCTAKLDDAQFVMVKTQPMYLCSGTNSKEFTTSNLRVAYYANQPGIDVVADLNKLNGFSWKGIPIKATNDGLVGLANGDLDYFLIVQSGVGNKTETGQLKCYASTQRNDKYPYLGNLFKASADLDLPLTVQHIIVTKNLSDAQSKAVRDELDPVKNAEFRKSLEFEGTVVQKITDNKRTLNEFRARAEDGIKTYKK